MFYKCNHCDPTVKRGEKPIKTVDTDKHLFIKDDKNKYFHYECYKVYLQKRKNLNEEEIEVILERMLRKSELEIKENTEKDKFLKWIMNFYDGSLPSYYLKKLNTVRKGEHEGLNEAITYETLLDIYQHMEKYLLKIAARKKIANVAQRMNYDLAVVIGNYGDYKRFKSKQTAFSLEKTEVDKQIKVDNKLKVMKNNVQEVSNEEDKEFDITDVIGELLL